MPTKSKTQVLQYTEEDVEYIWKYYSVDEKTVKQSVEILKNWLKQEQHLPQVATDDLLERILMRNKFRIERTKQKLDDYYTLRSCYSDYFLDNYNGIVPSKEVRQILPMPKLTEARERVVYICKVGEDDGEPDLRRFFCLMNAGLEFFIHNDYSIGEKFIFDCLNVDFEELKAWTITKLFNLYKINAKVYSGRVLSVDIINAPPYAIPVLNLLKGVLPEKIYSRLRIHNDLESLYKSVPKKCLPADLGGDLGTIKELTSVVDQVFMEHHDFFNEVTKHTSNEALRVGELRQDELYGLEGNFKQLDID